MAKKETCIGLWENASIILIKLHSVRITNGGSHKIEIMNIKRKARYVMSTGNVILWDKNIANQIT